MNSPLNNYFSQYLNSGSQQEQPEIVVPKAESNDRQRARTVTQEKGIVEQLLEGLEVSESVRSLLSYNFSTSSAASERKIPTVAEKVKALYDFWTFVDIINFHGGSMAFSECHREMVAFKVSALSFRQLILEARGHLKSTLLCVGYVLWRIYQNPNIRIFVGTESLKLSKAFIREIEQYLVDDFNKEHVWNARPHFDGPLIPEMDSLGKQRRQLVRDISAEFGEEYVTSANASTSKKVWRAEAIQVVRPRVMKEPTLVAGSVGQTSTGFHYDEVVMDDVHTYDNSSNETKIQKIFSWIFDIESVLDPPYVDIDLVMALNRACKSHFDLVRRWAISGGRMSVIGTRYDDLDYYGHIIDNKEKLGFDVHLRNIYVNGVDESEGYRWPEKWNKAVEEATKANFIVKHGTTGLSRYYSQYHNKIVNLEDAVLDWEKIQYINSQYVKLEEDGWVTIFNPDATVKAQIKPQLVIDPTTTATKKSDFCAIAVGGVCENKLYVVDFWMKRERPEVWLKVMFELVEKWNLHQVTIEMVGGFKILEFTIQNMWLNDNTLRPISIKSYNPTHSDEGKMQRIETTLSPLVHNEMLYLPLHCSRNDELRKQFIFFGKETAKDDGPDVLSIMRETALMHKRPKQNKDKKPYLTVVNSMYGGVEYEESVRPRTPEYDAA